VTQAVGLRIDRLVRWRWVIYVAIIVSATPGYTQTFNCQIPVPTLKDRMIAESIARYPGNCPCPYNKDARGRNCGKRSAWNRAGGYAPLCFSGRCDGRYGPRIL
jgi:hypothetical protein